MKPTWDETWIAVAEVIARRSGCTRSGVGAVVVDATNRIVATGYNGPPAGLRSEITVGGRHTDASCDLDCPRAALLRPPTPNLARGVGDAPCADDETCLLPAGHPDDGWGHYDGTRWTTAPVPDPGYSDCISIHAEANALLFTDRRTHVGGAIYVTGAVCYTCAKLIANSGLVRAVYRVGANEAHRDPSRTRTFLQRSGLDVVELV